MGHVSNVKVAKFGIPNIGEWVFMAVVILEKFEGFIRRILLTRNIFPYKYLLFLKKKKIQTPSKI